MTGILKRNLKSKNTAKYFYCDDSEEEYLFCILCSKSKVTVHFSREVLDYLFLHSQTFSTVCIILENGIVELKFPSDINYLFRGESLVFRIHSLDLFDELIDLTFCRRSEINCGNVPESNLFGLGISITSENTAETSFLSKITRLPFFSLVSFLICNNENKFWGIKKPIIKNDNFQNYLKLKNKDFKTNMRNVLAFYLNSPQQSNVVFSDEALKNNKNIFLVFLFTSYVFHEDDLYRKLFSFHGEIFFSVLRMRRRLDFYVNNLINSKSFLTARNFYSELEEFGFFVGSKNFLFFQLNKFCRSNRLNGNFFLLKEKCFASNIRKYNISVGRDWGMALLPGACVPTESNGKYQLIIYPDMENEILFKHNAVKISVAISETEINITYDFPLLEKITVIISPFRIHKIYKNSEYVPLIVKKNTDCIEINSGAAGNINISIKR